MKRQIEAAKQQNASGAQRESNLTHDYPGLMRLRQRLTDRSMIPPGSHDGTTVSASDATASPANPGKRTSK